MNRKRKQILLNYDDIESSLKGVRVNERQIKKDVKKIA